MSDDFDEQLVGVTSGDERSFTTTPKGTAEPVDVTIKVSRVQELVPPELTDEWVAENIGEFDTVAEWTDSIRARLADTKLHRSRSELIGRTTAELVKLTDIEPPAALVNSDLRRRVEGTARQLAAQGIDIEQFLSATGQDTNTFIDRLRPESEQAVRLDLALRVVAAAEDLAAADDDVAAEYQRIALQTGQKVARVRNAYEAGGVDVEIRAQIRKSKALDWLLHNVELVDPDGNPVDRDELLGHQHDDDDDDVHDDDPADGGEPPNDVDDAAEAARP